MLSKSLMNQERAGRGSLSAKLSLIAVIATALAHVSACIAQERISPIAAEYVPTLTFDVASVRQSPRADSYSVGGGFADRSSSLSLTNFDLWNLLSMAYGIRRDQIMGLTDLFAIFNVQAKSDSDTDARLAKLTDQQRSLEQQHMLQVLLADRFELKVHWEMREGPTYNLLIAKNGVKLVSAKGGPPTPEEIKIWGNRPIPALYQQGDGTSYSYIAHGCSIDLITEMLAMQFGQSVSDKTGLTGRYDFTLRYRDTRQSDRSPDDFNPIPPLEMAIQDQLGLKLERSKGPTRFLVVDHIEKPSAN
jgi:uncharacterized protein (TIGR03435 family)